MPLSWGVVTEKGHLWVTGASNAFLWVRGREGVPRDVGEAETEHGATRVPEILV